VVDDEPARVAERVPELAALGRTVEDDEPGVIFMTEVRGASNENAKRGLDWQPRWPSRRRSFVDGLGYASRARAPASTSTASATSSTLESSSG
jgi:hypothetical protein